MGPHHIRTLKAFKVTGLIPGPMDPEGRPTLINAEMKGPPDYAHWRKCWNVFSAAMVFAGSCLPTWLNCYADKIMEYNAIDADATGYSRLWAFL